MLYTTYTCTHERTHTYEPTHTHTHARARARTHTHTHTQSKLLYTHVYRYKNCLEEVISRALAHGVHKMIVCATTLEDAQQAILLAESLPGVLYCTVGVHPHQAKVCTYVCCVYVVVCPYNVNACPCVCVVCLHIHAFTYVCLDVVWPGMRKRMYTKSTCSYYCVFPLFCKIFQIYKLHKIAHRMLKNFVTVLCLDIWTSGEILCSHQPSFLMLSHIWCALCILAGMARQFASLHAINTCAYFIALIVCVAMVW